MELATGTPPRPRKKGGDAGVVTTEGYVRVRSARQVQKEGDFVVGEIAEKTGKSLRAVFAMTTRIV
jgi:hypothetical protein